MSDVVNGQDNDQDNGALAAEFVLGTLDSDERDRANELLDRDPHFRGMVRVWERRLGELHLMVEPVEPPTPIWDRIKGNLPGVEQDAEADLPVAPAPEEPVAAPRPPSDTIATLEALEAELREEGLAPPRAPAIGLPAPVVEPPAPAMEPPPLATTRELDWEPAAAHQDRTATPAPHAPVRSGRLFATLMTLVAIALAGLIAAWRYIPDRLPPQMRAEHVLNIHIPAPPPAPVRPPAPPESQFDE